MKNHVYIYNRSRDLGIPVVDSKERQFVGVTPDDVLRARKANSKHCALARASLRLPEVNAAYFFRSTAFLEYADKILRFHLPQSVQREIVSFDRSQIFSPGVYQLTPIPDSQSRAKMAEHKRDLQAGRKRIKVRETKPRERAALKAAIAIVERVSPESIKKLALEQGTRKPQTSATVKTSTATGTKAGPAPKPRYKLEGVTGDKRRDSISGVVTSKAPSPLLPTGRYYRKSQYVRDLDEPV